MDYPDLNQLRLKPAFTTGGGPAPPAAINGFNNNQHNPVEVLQSESKFNYNEEIERNPRRGAGGGNVSYPDRIKSINSIKLEQIPGNIPEKKNKCCKCGS